MNQTRWLQAHIARPDLSPYLTHFTRSRCLDGKSISAFDMLVKILKEGKIRGGTNYIKGGEPTTCFFNAPWPALARVITEENRRRYEPYGIGVSKLYGFKKSARPVIYLPEDQAKKLLPPAEMWRVVELKLTPKKFIDWTHEREWRKRGDFPLDPKWTWVLVHTGDDIERLYKKFKGKPPCRAVISLRPVFIGS